MLTDKETEDCFQIIDDFRVSPEDRLFAAKKLVGYKPDLHSVCEIDLHCHSFYSDGYCSPSMRVFEAYRRGLKAIAVCDHDVFDGQRELIDAGQIFGVTIVPSIEFYTDRPGIEIIAHFPDVPSFIELLDSGITDELIEPIRSAKRKQLDGMIDRIPECFSRLGLDAVITPEDIDIHVRNGVSTKGDISVIMWEKYGDSLAEKEISTDVKDFQARYTTQDEMLNLPLELDMDLSPEAFVKRIHSWGGLPGLPHPSELRKKEDLGNDELKKVIDKLAEVGLQTIEVDGWRNSICPETGLHQTDLFNQMRLDYNESHSDSLPLLFTNGSDDHNQPCEDLELGCGLNNNLRPEFGRLQNIEYLLKRQKAL